jgi:alpha-galactosidase
MPIHQAYGGWVLETRTTGYALGLNEAGLLAHRYWGPRLPRPEDYPPPPNPREWASFNGPAHLTPQEYPGYAGTSYVDPCLKLTFADGTRDVVLRFEAAETRSGPTPELDLQLRDVAYGLRLTLHYRVHAAHDLVERWATLHNESDAPLTIERAFSAQWHVPAGDSYRLSHLTGRWADEFQLRREPLGEGRRVIESRRLTTSHHHSPWYTLDRGAGEEHGEVWFGTLAWSGNWQIAAEVTQFGSTHVTIGLNDWDFAWRLDPGQAFTTPGCYGGYTSGGYGAASRLLHDFVRETLVPHPGLARKVLYNSWEATHFDVDEESQGALAELAAVMGVELFVMDDGWFHGRDHDRAGLGDWWPDERKFPRGLAPLIERVHALGMDFGLWIEPEMVNPDSELYRAHPDWTIHFPTRQPTEARHQLILNVARADVRAYLLERLDWLLREHRIDFIKWDMNRNVSEPGWPEAPGDQRELWVRYVEGLYELWGELRRRHPHVVWQTCSGGGGRADYGILRLADQVWTSDNTQAAARLPIQEGFSQLFPASVMEAWVTDWDAERYPLEFRLHVSMCGALGIGGHLLRWSPAERAEAARWIALYKEIRHLVQAGDLYRLRPVDERGYSALQYVARDRSEAVLFAFCTRLPFPPRHPPLYLRGLDPQALYTVEGVDGARSGQAWMSAGLTVELRDLQSAVRRVRRV